MANLNDERSLLKIAKTIFAFEIGQSCSLTGFAEDPDSEEGASPRGEMVLKLLKELYNDNYIRKDSKGSLTKSRTRIHLTNSIGGTLAHPIWRYKQEIKDKQIKYNIWRIQ